MDKEKLAEMTGEKEVLRPKTLKLPIVRLDGRKGVYTIMKLKKDGTYADKEEIGQMFEGIIVKVRQQLGSFSAKFRRNSNEYDSVNEKIKIFETNKEGTKLLMEGYPKELRQQFQDLRGKRILYMLSYPTFQLVRVELKGATLKHLFDYFNEFQSQHLFEVVTKIDSTPETNDAGMDYYTSLITKGKDVTDQEIIKVSEAIESVSASIKAVKEYYASQDKPNEPAIKDIPKEDIETIEYPEDDKEIKPEDIPF